MARKAILLLVLLVAGAVLLNDIRRESGAPDYWQGYIDDETVLIAPLDTERVSELLVKRGDRVKKGEPVFRIGGESAKAAYDAAAARVAQAQATLENLKTGKRPQEIAVDKAKADDARAALELAKADYKRKAALFESGDVTRAALDNAKAALDSAKAKLASAEREVGASALPARPQEIEAATQSLAAAEAELEAKAWELKRREVLAPADGVIEDVIRYAGEVGSPQQPVLLLLPDDAHRIRFFVPEGEIATLKKGMRIKAACDSCGEGLEAVVTYISPKAEYTPPVIYSVQSREKLVFMAEAEPAGSDTSAWRAGLPVDVRPQP